MNNSSSNQNLETQLENMNLFKEFLSSNHTNLEYKNFYFDMIEKCPQLKRFMFINEQHKFNKNDISNLYIYYDKYVIKRSNKSKKNKKINSKLSLYKKYDKNIKLIKIIKWLVTAVMAVTLFIINLPMYTFYRNNTKTKSIVFALAIIIYVLVYILFEYISFLQDEHYKDKIKQINETKAKSDNLINNYKSLFENYTNSINNYSDFLQLLYFYESIFQFIEELKLLINTSEINYEINKFNTYYQENIQIIISETDEILLNQFDLFYINNQEKYVSKLKGAYNLTITFLNSISNLLTQITENSNIISNNIENTNSENFN